MVALRRTVAAAVLVLIGAVATLLYALRIAPHHLEVVRLRVSLPGLHPEWSGVRIAHLTDFHAGGPGVSLAMLHRARHVAENFRPDLLALTGDFYNGGTRVTVDGLFSAWPPNVFRFAVLGNHDDRGGIARVQSLVRELDDAGVRVLRNEAVCITLRGRDALIVGVDDPYAGKMDDEKAFGDVLDSAEVLLYLAHSPAAATTMPVARVGLLVAGHTHGGQVRITRSGRIPFIAHIRRFNGAPQRNDPLFFHGVHWYRGAVVVISNGLGVSQLPLRFLARPQVVLIELGTAASSDVACDEVSRYVTRLR